MLRTVILLVLMVILLPACSAPTYINVPPADGDVAFNDANGNTVRTLEKKALGAILAERNYAGDVAIRFPQGTTELTAITVIAELPDNVILEADSATGEYTLIEIREVRVRGGTAQIDIVRPGTTLARELVTVTLKWKAIGGWIYRSSKVWGIDMTRPGADRFARPAADPSTPSFEQVEPQPAPEDAPEQAPEEELQIDPEPIK